MTVSEYNIEIPIKNDSNAETCELTLMLMYVIML